MKIIIADNQYFTQQSISAVLNEEFPGSEIIITDSVAGIFKITADENISLLIIDPDTLKLNDIVELAVFRKRNPITGILIITNNKNFSFIKKVTDKGIRNFIFKDCSKEVFINAVSSALNDQQYFDQRVMEALVRNEQDEDEQEELTKAEMEVVRLIAHGFTTKEIAAKKYLSYHTIITHRKNIFRKLKIKNISELMMYAVKSGIIDTTEYYI
jgi:DNA-binding NarL/FixJ family response regulator